MTAVTHGWSNTIVARLIKTTPAATSRADTSLTGSGNASNARTDIRTLLFFGGGGVRDDHSSSGCRAPGGDAPQPARPELASPWFQDRDVSRLSWPHVSMPAGRLIDARAGIAGFGQGSASRRHPSTRNLTSDSSYVLVKTDPQRQKFRSHTSDFGTPLAFLTEVVRRAGPAPTRLARAPPGGAPVNP